MITIPKAVARLHSSGDSLIVIPRADPQTNALSHPAVEMIPYHVKRDAWVLTRFPEGLVQITHGGLK